MRALERSNTPDMQLHPLRGTLFPLATVGQQGTVLGDIVFDYRIVP